MIEFVVVGGQCLGKDGTQTKGANVVLQAKNSNRQRGQRQVMRGSKVIWLHSSDG
jgi:hypothetical protein